MKKLILLVILLALTLTSCGIIIDTTPTVKTTAEQTTATTKATTQAATEATTQATTEATTEATTAATTTAAETEATESTTETAATERAGLTVKTVASPVSAGSTGSITVVGKPNTEYKITVY